MFYRGQIEQIASPNSLLRVEMAIHSTTGNARQKKHTGRA
jgi:hypothetical protein